MIFPLIYFVYSKHTWIRFGLIAVIFPDVAQNFLINYKRHEKFFCVLRDDL